MPVFYPSLDKEKVQKTEECQSDSESFVGSPKATSTPIADGPALRKKATPRKVNETILAGYTHRISYHEYNGEHSHTSTSIVQSVLSPAEYWNTLGDFKECCNNGDWWNFFIKHHLRILFVLCILMVIYSLWASILPSNLEMWKNYKKELRLLRKDYPELTKADENTLLVVGQQWIIDAKSEPVVLTVAGPYSGTFTQKLFDLVLKISNGKTNRHVITSGNTISRAQLHNLVQLELDSKSMPMAALRHIDELVWDAPLVIQAFADPDSSPINNALLILSVEGVRPVPKTCEADLTEYLTEKWISNGGSIDNVPPVIARILGYSICV